MSLQSKLKNYAYGLVESGRIWKLVVQYWIVSRNLSDVPSMPQLFIERDEQSNVALEIEKVVDDFLIGLRKNFEDFHATMASRNKIGRFLLIDQELIFNGVRIRPGRITISFIICVNISS